jgi:hypothetical protein
MAIKTIKPGPGKPPKKAVTYKATTRKAASSDTISPMAKPKKQKVTGGSMEEYKQIRDRMNSNLTVLKQYKDTGKFPGKQLSQAMSQQDSLKKHPYHKEYIKTYGKIKNK